VPSVIRTSARGRRSSSTSPKTATFTAEA
jgi:hypothetical protein